MKQKHAGWLIPIVVHRKMNLNDQLIETAQQGDLDLARNALQAGADVDATYRNVTALWWACQEGHFEIVKLLVSRGADVNVRDEDGFTPATCPHRMNTDA